MGLAFDVYSAAAPNGSLLATLTDAKEKQVSFSLRGIGAGSFSIPRSSAQATTAIIAQGNLVKVRLTELSATPIGAFWMEVGRFDLVGATEGTEMLTFGGQGARAYLGRAIMWSQTFLAAEIAANTGPVDNEWPLWKGVNGSKAGAILKRLVDESIAGTRPQQPLPSLSTDFSYTLDSAGNIWSTTPGTNAFIAHVGDYLDDVIAELLGATSSMVIQMDANLGLHAYNTFGTNRTSATFAAGKVRMQKGVNVSTALTRELAAQRIKSHILAAGDPGFYGSASSAITPVREGFASSSGDDVSALNALATSQITIRQSNADSIRLGIPYGNTPLSGVYLPGPASLGGHYWLGDTITVHTGTGQHDYNESGQVVAEIALSEDDAGTPVVEVALGSTYSGADFSSIHDAITEVRTDVSNSSNEALRYAHSLITPKVVSALPTLPDPSYPMGSIVFLTTDAKLYRNTTGLADGWSVAVDGADIVAGTILAGAIAAGAITTEALAAVLVLASTIKTADAGARVELDPAGFRAYSGAGDILMNIPTDGSPVYVNAVLEALSLSVTGNAGFYGALNHLGASSVTQVDLGIANPSQAPTLAQDWPATEFVPQTGLSVASPQRVATRGLSYDAAGGAGGATKVFWTAGYGASGLSGQANDGFIVELLASDLSVNRKISLGYFPSPAVICGAARLGTNLYVLLHDQTGQTWVRRYTASTLAVNADYLAVSFPTAYISPTIASDGTNIYIMDGGNGTSFKWNKYDASMVKVGSTIDTTYNPAGGVTLRDVAAGSFDFGAFRIVGAFQGGTGINVQTFDSTGVRQANEKFESDATSGNAWGITYGDARGDGARFWSIPEDGLYVVKHSAWTWTTASPIYWVGYAWYDDVGTVHETMVGPRSSITMGRRKMLTITGQAIPGAGGADDPNKVRVYVVNSATAPATTALHLQLTSVTPTNVLVGYNAAGAAPATSNGFLAVAVPATLQSEAQPGWTLKGDGSAIFDKAQLASGTLLRFVRNPLGVSNFINGGAGATTLQTSPELTDLPANGAVYVECVFGVRESTGANVSMQLFDFDGTSAALGFTSGVAARGGWHTGAMVKLGGLNNRQIKWLTSVATNVTVWLYVVGWWVEV